MNYINPYNPVKPENSGQVQRSLHFKSKWNTDDTDKADFFRVASVKTIYGDQRALLFGGKIEHGCCGFFLLG
ncbi:MAG TPA: hypothetical protein VK957_13560 [Lunatimonas sp.]|nr:hypothetical protein [Lunatimonas sp.]